MNSYGDNRFQFRFNTGRGYQSAGHKFAGQVIDVWARTDGTAWTVRFEDYSRGIPGAFICADIGPEDQASIRERVMWHYDHNAYTDPHFLEILANKVRGTVCDPHRYPNNLHAICYQCGHIRSLAEIRSNNV